MNGFSLPEMLIVLLLISLSATFSLIGFTNTMQNQAAQNFENHLSSAIHLAQELSLTRNETFTICAQKLNKCQKNWYGNLVLIDENQKLLQNFGITPKSINIEYSGFLSKDFLLIQNHGLLVNNGTFHLTTTHKIYDLIISKQGIISLNEEH